MFFHVGGVCMHNVNNLYQTGPIAEKKSLYATFFLNQFVVTNKSDRRDITEILLKLSLNPNPFVFVYLCLYFSDVFFLFYK
jgi:hypothetical protein